MVKGDEYGEGLPSKMADLDPIPQFDLPVDSEHKAKALKIYSFKAPHMRSFHLNWISFFVSFLSTFAAAPLIVYIRQDLNLNKSAVAGANLAAVTGTVFARVVMGSACDRFGPRFGTASILLLTSSAVFGIAAVETPAAFVVCRCIIGFSLSVFVCCQFWTSVMFSPNVVATANATAGGWGNAGGGVTQLVMPSLYNWLHTYVPSFVAWRWAYFIPGGIHIIVAVMVLAFAQDLPDGNFADCRKKGTLVKPKSAKELWVALRNYRTWCLFLTYGFSFGVELTVDNNIAEYFHDQFNLSVTTAGYYGAIFGCFNFVSRPLGGILSDTIAKRYGIRGRMWWVWFLQTSGGLLCVLLGVFHSDLTSTLTVLCFFSFFIQAACGATYGLVPFVSKRALGMVCGMVGAGGNAGAAITQAIFFTPATLAAYDGFLYMGCMILGVAQLHTIIYFPAWGGMIFPARKGASEEDYYFSEFSAAEQEQGLHRSVMKFANESRSQRGMKRIQAEATANTAAIEPVQMAYKAPDTP